MIPALLKLRALPWRWIGGAALVLLAVWQIRAYADRVADEREGEIRALWEADTAARDKAAAEAIAAEVARQEAQRRQNEETEREYLEKVAAAESGRAELERVLLGARREVRIAASREASSLTIAAQASEARRLEELRRLDDRIAAATADLRVEAGQNADQLDAVLAELEPQM